MKLGENKFLKGAINPEHKGYCTPMSKSTCTPRRKALARRFKKGGDLLNESRSYPELSPADEAIVMHQADQLLEDINSYELSLDGNEIVRPECPHCGGQHSEEIAHGQYHCPNCNAPFRLDVTQYPAHKLPPAKASFYPSDGGGAGGGGGVTSA